MSPNGKCLHSDSHNLDWSVAKVSGHIRLWRLFLSRFSVGIKVDQLRESANQLSSKTNPLAGRRKHKHQHHHNHLVFALRCLSIIQVKYLYLRTYTALLRNTFINCPFCITLWAFDYNWIPFFTLAKITFFKRKTPAWREMLVPGVDFRPHIDILIM